MSKHSKGLTDIQEYHRDNGTWGLVKIAICLAVIFVVLYCLFGCSMERKVSKAYEKAAAYSPLSKKDTANAFIVSRKVVKEKPPIIKPGKTIRVPYPVNKIIKVPDTNAIRKVRDSIADLLTEQGINLTEDWNKSIDASYNEGFKDGQKVNSKDSFDQKLPDTLIPDQKVQQDLDQCQFLLNNSNEALIKAQTSSDIYKGQSKKKGWTIAGLIALLVASVFFNVKSFLKKSVPILNDK